MLRSMMVYLVRLGELYKVGTTQNLSRRIRALELGSTCHYRFVKEQRKLGHMIELVYSFASTDPYRCERFLHQLFCKQMCHNEWSASGKQTEWFRLTDEQVAWFCGIRSDKDVLPMKQLTKEEFLGLLQDRVSESGTQRAAAQSLGVTYGHLNDVLRNRKEPGAKILSALNATTVTNYLVGQETTINEERVAHKHTTRPLRFDGQHQNGRNRRLQQLSKRPKGSAR